MLGISESKKKDRLPLKSGDWTIPGGSIEIAGGFRGIRRGRSGRKHKGPARGFMKTDRNVDGKIIITLLHNLPLPGGKRRGKQSASR